MRINSIQSTNQNLYSQISFGRKIAGEEFSEVVIKEAERILKKNGTVNADAYKKDLFECFEDAKFQPLEWILYPYAKGLEKLGGEEASLGDIRKALGIGTLGISELLKAPEAGIRKIVTNIKANNFAEDVRRCMLAIMREKH